MKFTKFLLCDDFRYRYKGSSNYAYFMLGLFFTDEVGSRPQDIVEWIVHPDALSFAGNITLMDKKRGGAIHMYFDPVMNLSEKEKDEIKRETGVLYVEEDVIISPKELMHLLGEWKRCRNEAYDEIWIKNDRGIFWVEGVK